MFARHVMNGTRASADQARRGRPPSRPFLRELASFLRLVRLPTSAAALTRATVGLRDERYDVTLATLTLACEVASGWVSRYAVNVRWSARSACVAVDPWAYTGNPAT